MTEFSDESVEITAEDIADIAAEIANEKDLPLVLLGGAADDFGPARSLADALRSAGERFLHANDLFCLPRAAYVIATDDERYSHYEFARGSAVIDQFGIIPDTSGVEIHRLDA